MKDFDKVVLSFIVTTILALGGAFILFSNKDVKVGAEIGVKEKTVSEAIVGKIDSTTVKYQEASKTEQQVMDSVKALFDRRAKGDEPTLEQWIAAESLVDQLRLNKDTPLLQKLDRLLETADGSTKIIEAAAEKI